MLRGHFSFIARLLGFHLGESISGSKHDSQSATVPQVAVQPSLLKNDKVVPLNQNLKSTSEDVTHPPPADANSVQPDDKKTVMINNTEQLHQLDSHNKLPVVETTIAEIPHPPTVSSIKTDSRRRSRISFSGKFVDERDSRKLFNLMHQMDAQTAEGGAEEVIQALVEIFPEQFQAEQEEDAVDTNLAKSLAAPSATSMRSAEKV